MGKKILYLILIVAVSGLTGYFAATRAFDRRAAESEEYAQIAGVATGDKKSVPQRRVEDK